MIALPQYVDVQMWSAFVETRKAMKVPFTQAAQLLIVRKLMKMHGEGWDVNASLEKSVIYGYRGVFEVSKIPQEPSKQLDPMLQKIERDKLITKPPSDQIKAQLAKLKGKTYA